MIRIFAAVAVTVVALGVAPAARAQSPTVAEGATVLTPVDTCRLADTREGAGYTRLDDHTIRVAVTGRCEVTAGATAAALNIVSVDTAETGHVIAYPSDIDRPDTSNINADRLSTIANSAIVALSADGSVDVYHSGRADLVVDITATFNGVTEAASAGRFVPTEPTRVIDTRETGQRGSGTVGVDTSDVVPNGAVAAVATVTTVDATGPGYATAWAAGNARPDTSTVNTDSLNRTRAVTAIISTNTGAWQGLDVYRHTTSDLVVDIVGYFTGADAEASTIGMFVPSAPERLVDTRTTDNPVHPGGTIETPVDIDGSSAVINLTAVDNVATGHAIAWAAGTPRPTTSNVNFTWRYPVAALAIVAVSDRGMALYSHSGSHIVADVSGHFTGARTAATEAPAPNTPQQTGGDVLFVSDSSFAGIRWTGALTYLQGATFDARLESCRRLSGVSCHGREGYAPLTADVDVAAAGVGFDTLVVATGYNDYRGTFQQGFEAVMNAARSNGISRVVWLTYREDVTYDSPGAASNAATFAANNAQLRHAAASGLWPELTIADWDAYTTPAGRRHWLSTDGVHLTYEGGPEAAMYVSRVLAFLDRRPCPSVIGGIETPGGWCANPDGY